MGKAVAVRFRLQFNDYAPNTSDSAKSGEQAAKIDILSKLRFSLLDARHIVKIA